MEPKKSLWNTIVERHGLVKTPYEEIANWEFFDFCLNFKEDVVLDTVKIRQAGFREYTSTDASLRRHLERLRAMKLIP